MNKWIWIVVIIILVVLGLFLFSGGDNSPEGGVGNRIVGAESGGDEVGQGNGIDDAPISEFDGLGSSDEVFEGINSALEFIE